MLIHLSSIFIRFLIVFSLYITFGFIWDYFFHIVHSLLYFACISGFPADRNPFLFKPAFVFLSPSARFRVYIIMHNYRIYSRIKKEQAFKSLFLKIHFYFFMAFSIAATRALNGGWLYSRITRILEGARCAKFSRASFLRPVTSALP